MTVVLTFVLLLAALFALFWGGALVAQGYWYQQPADRLPVRAAGAAALVAAFLTLWVALDRSAPGKYDTFFEFAPYSTAGFDEFEAVRWQADPGGKGLRLDPAGQPAETATRYKRAGGKSAAFAENGTGPAFKLSTATDMTGAIVVTPAGGAPVRFDAELKEDPRTKQKTYFGEKRFVEAATGRYVRGDQPGVLYIPSTGVVVAALALNALLFVVFFAAFWPGLGFDLWHAVGLAAAFGLATMLLVMPLLFKPNRGPRAAPEAVARMDRPAADVG